MNDTRFAPNARYLLKIVSNGEWATVAYLNDFEEAKRTIAAPLFASGAPGVAQGRA